LAQRAWRYVPTQSWGSVAAVVKSLQANDAAIIGGISAGQSHFVLETELGGERLLEELDDDPLPRIC
jgi:hydrogenase expression/formation protein HypE